MEANVIEKWNPVACHGTTTVFRDGVLVKKQCDALSTTTNPFPRMHYSAASIRVGTLPLYPTQHPEYIVRLSLESGVYSFEKCHSQEHYDAFLNETVEFSICHRHRERIPFLYILESHKQFLVNNNLCKVPIQAKVEIDDYDTIVKDREMHLRRTVNALVGGKK